MKKKIYFWACDIDQHRGEGILGQQFIDLAIKNNNLESEVETFNKKFFFRKKKFYYINKKKITKLNFFSNYFYPFYGIIKCWINYFKGNKVHYVNYLPLWNFLIFLLLPSRTILGPITGGIYGNKSNFFQFKIRKYIFPIFYRISLFLLKDKKLLFSTDLLKKFVKEKKYKKVIYNFSLINLREIPKQKKKYDLIIYFRKHSNKYNEFQSELLKYLSKKNIKIVVIGDHLKINRIINKNNVSRKKALRIIGRSKFALNSPENPLSLFVTDSISNRTFIFYNKKVFSSVLKKIIFSLPINYEIDKKHFIFIYNKIKKFKKNKLNFKEIINLKKNLIIKLDDYFVG